MNELLLISNIILWLVVVVLAAMVLALGRQVGVLFERVAPAGALAVSRAAQAGDDAPSLTVQTLEDTWISVGGARQDEHSTLLFFLSPNCPICKKLLPIVRRVHRAERAWLDVVLVSDGDEDHRAFVARESLTDMPYVLSQELGMAFGVSKLPFAALIDGAGRISASGIVNSREHIESLFEAQDRGIASLQEYLANEEETARRDVA